MDTLKLAARWDCQELFGNIAPLIPLRKISPRDVICLAQQLPIVMREWLNNAFGTYVSAGDKFTFRDAQAIGWAPAYFVQEGLLFLARRRLDSALGALPTVD